MEENADAVKVARGRRQPDYIYPSLVQPSPLDLTRVTRE